MRNLEIADIMENIAELLEIKGENPFKIRAYHRVSQVLRDLPHDLGTIKKEGGLRNIPGVGEGIEKKIIEVLETGRIKFYESLKKEIPEGILDIMAIPYMGPKKAKLVYNELGIKDIEGLEKAVRKHKLKDLSGMGLKTEENILKGIELLKSSKGRMLLGIAYPVAESIVSELKKLKEVDKISYAGSLRRMKETIGDVDILVTSNKRGALRSIKRIGPKGEKAIQKFLKENWPLL